MAHLALHFLGTFHVTLDNQPITDIESGKARALLIYLAIESAEPHSREELIGLLWPDRPEVTARANLRQAIANLRHVLGDRSTDPPFLLVSGDTVQFNRQSDYWLDVAAFDDHLRAYAQHPHPRSKICHQCIQHLQAAAELYRGDFLSKFYQGSAPFEEWVLLKREHWHHRTLDALSRLADYHGRRFAHDLAWHYAVRQIELDPWREEAHRQAMQALALNGQRSAALAQYEKCRRILAKELNVEPASATTDLYEKIKTGQLTVDVDPLFNLAEAIPLIGRERELAEIDRLLTDSTCRVVTLTGSGGVGKTQLALHAAASQPGAFADGIRFISLAAVNSADALVATLAAALGLALNAATEPQAQLAGYLAQRELLLVLDNFEQLLSAGAEVVAALMAGAPQTTCLVTSRERLNLRDEWVIEVRGLGVPPDDQAGDIRDYGAIQLFIDRVERNVGPRPVSAEEWPHIASICRLTAGLPLAIELAAAWARHWSFADIARELARSLDFATAPLYDLPERHRSLRAVFDQSWQLLTPMERAGIQALAVFRGGFDRAAAEQIAGVNSRGLAALVDKSLLQTVDEHRLEMHEVIRQYADEQLRAAGASDLVRARHSDYFRRQVQQAEADLIGAGQARRMLQIDADIDNLRAALQWSIAARPEDALEISSRLWCYWLVRGFFAEGRGWLEQALSATEANRGTCIRARALTGAANLAWLQGDYAEARQLAEQSVSLCQILNDRQGLARALTVLGIAAGYHGDHIVVSAAALKESVALCRASQDQWGLAMALFYLADGDAVPQTTATAPPLLAESRSIFQTLGDRRGTALAMRGLGAWAYRSGDLSAATAWLRRALNECRAIGDRWLAAQTLNSLGEVAQHEDRIIEAEQLYAESLNLYRELGVRRHEAQLLRNLGHIALRRHDVGRATRFFAESLAIFRQLGDAGGIAAALVGLGGSPVVS